VLDLWLRGRRWLLDAFASFSSLLFLSPAFLGALAIFDDFVHLTDDVLSVRQEVSIFVDWCVPRRHQWPVDVGDVWERDKALAIGSIDLFYRPVPLKPCLASFGTFNNFGWFVGIRVHVRPRIAHKRCRPWFVSIGKSGGFRDIPREVWSERNKRRSSITQSPTMQAQNEEASRLNAVAARV
jgi:hypothetical protein